MGLGPPAPLAEEGSQDGKVPSGQPFRFASFSAALSTAADQWLGGRSELGVKSSLLTIVTVLRSGPVKYHSSSSS